MRQQRPRSLRSTPKHHIPEAESMGLSLSDKEDLRLNRLRVLIEKLERRTLTNAEELYEMLACYSFFQKIYSNNVKAYQALMEHVEVELLERGRVVAMYGEKALKTFFVLKGQLAAYVRTAVSSDKSKSYKEEYGEELIPEPINKNPVLKRKATMIQEQNSLLTFNQRKQREYNKIFESEEEVTEWFPDLTKVASIRQQESIDVSALRKNVNRAATLITEQPTILVAISKANFLEVASKHEITAVLQDRQDILRSFPIFSAWEKKLNTMSVYFERRRFKRGEVIFKEGASADCFYLIVEGEVELSIQVPIKPAADSKERSIHAGESIKVAINILGQGNYLGEEEMLKKAVRKVTAQPLSAFVQVLYLTKKNFFLVGYGSDFFYQLKLNLEVKIMQRQQVIKRHVELNTTMKNRERTPEKTEIDLGQLFLSKPKKVSNVSKINNHPPRTGQGAVKYLHGNRIIQPKPNHKTEVNEVQFSMLQSNKEMYKETLKKFRRFHKKEQPRQKSEVNWDMKRVWKVLNLDDVLPEDLAGTHSIRKDETALCYYYKSNRLASQISQGRALRPKTSSSSHRQKVTYVNYLAEFVELANRKQSLA